MLLKGIIENTYLLNIHSLGGEHSVVTSNANDSRPRENRSNETRNNNYKPRVNRDNENHGEGRTYNGNRENRPFNKEGRPYNKDAKPFNRESRPYNKQGDSNNRTDRPARPFKRDGESTERTGGFQRDNNGFRGKDTRGGSYNSYNKDRGFNKDRDYDTDRNEGRSGKSYGSKDQRMKDAPTKEKEQQPDKFETIKRIEREKKAMQKKQESKKTEKQAKPQVKQKRTNNIDWTRGYQNGLYDDDDEDYTMLM